MSSSPKISGTYVIDGLFNDQIFPLLFSFHTQKTLSRGDDPKFHLTFASTWKTRLEVLCCSVISIGSGVALFGTQASKKNQLGGGDCYAP